MINQWSVGKRVSLALIALAVGILIAGFWNYKLVDGIGRDWIAASIIGHPDAVTYADKGTAFGFIFAAAAGLAASFTACNCVVFAMLPSLACATDRKSSKKRALLALALFAVGVLAVCAVYGAYVTSLGVEGVQAFNDRGMRISQAQTTFTWIGAVLLVWGGLSFGFLGRLTNLLSPRLLSILSSAYTKASIMGLMAGFFAVGRPYPIFREFILYAAESGSPGYGSLAMMTQGLGQIAVMVVLYLLLIGLFGKRLTKWMERKPHQPLLISSIALMAGGAFFVYYWGFAFWYDIGQWGFKLGWYK
ncbi:hypothetical protein [Cohnella soli]|uniref:Cytochrome C biogenesis protein transmembrane domain-containing protein n=1 Tax=Cohnella soli TaxID=425005 RepID=A0ABW0I354_9BACL